MPKPTVWFLFNSKCDPERWKQEGRQSPNIRDGYIEGGLRFGFISRYPPQLLICNRLD